MSTDDAVNTTVVIVLNYEVKYLCGAHMSGVTHAVQCSIDTVETTFDQSN